jgi:hypothetical protein
MGSIAIDHVYRRYLIVFSSPVCPASWLLAARVVSKDGILDNSSLHYMVSIIDLAAVSSVYEVFVYRRCSYLADEP